MRKRIVRDRAGLVVALLAILLAAGRGTALAQVEGSDAEWSNEARLKAYQHDLFGVPALVGLAATSTYDHLRDDPEEWDDGAEGLGIRVASNAGRIVVGQSVRHGLAAALSRSTRYRRCECTGFFPRIGHAFVETVTDRNREGERWVSIPRIGGSLAGAYAQMLWRPEITAGEAAVDAAGGILYGAGVNAVRELIGW